MSDAEAARPPAQRSCRCLDAALVASVAFLYLCVLGGAVYTALYLRLEGEAQVPPTEETPRSPEARKASGLHNGQAHLEKVAFWRVETGQVKNLTMVSWKAVQYGEGHSQGAFYSYNSKQFGLTVKKGGSYLLLVSLKFSCTSGSCKGEKKASGKFTLDFKKFKCQVDLREGPIQQCVDVMFLPSDTKLLAQMRVTDSDLNWKVDPNDSKLGIVLLEELA